MRRDAQTPGDGAGFSQADFSQPDIAASNMTAHASMDTDPLRPAPYIERDDRPTLLVVGPPGSAQTLVDWATRTGFRSIGTVELTEAASRLGHIVAVDLILADLRGVALDAANGRALALRHGLPDARLAVLTDLAGVDSAFAALDGPGTDIVCEPKTSDIVSLLVMVALSARGRQGDPRLHDTSRETEAARIEQLSEEVRRLATTIDRLTQHSGLGAASDPALGANAGPRPMGQNGAERTDERLRTPNGPAADNMLGHSEIRALLRARRMRDQFMPLELFADPAWDMILDLMAARLAGQRVSVSSLCIAASVPPTTALRWIRQLTERGIFSRIDDPADGRRVFIALTDDTASAFMAWAQAVRRNGGLLSPSEPN